MTTMTRDIQPRSAQAIDGDGCLLAANTCHNELTAAEKLELLDRPWGDLSRHPQTVPSPAWHGAVLDERRAAVQEGRTTFVAWEEVR